LRLSIPLSDASSDALRRLAYRELRHPQMQAKYLLEEALRARGILPAEPTEQDAATDRADNRTPVGAT